MSNYIVKPESIAKIANLIKYANYNRWGLSMPESVHNAFAYCKNEDGFFEEEKICKFLAIENFLAVDDRYKRDTDADEIEAFYNEAIKLLKDNYTPTPIYKDFHRVLTPEHIQLYKTLQCFVYQIDEDLTYKDAIFKSLKELENAMSHWIVANSVDYINANWE